MSVKTERQRVADGGVVGPNFRAGRFLAGSPVLNGRLGDPPLPRRLQILVCALARKNHAL